MSNSVTFIVTSLLIVLLTNIKADLKKKTQSYHGNHSYRVIGNAGKVSWGGFSVWPDFKSDFIVDNWKRKCEKYNIENSVKTLITGGLKAEVNMFPYLVGLLIHQPPRVYQCGGSLITQRYVLTAAHCLYRSIEAQVYLGSYIYANIENAVSVYNVTARHFIIHERYGRMEFNDDIALIYLPEPATLSQRVRTIALAHSYMTQAFLQGEIVTTAGWGRISDNKTEQNVQLYYTDTRVIGYEKCMCYYLPGLVNSRSHVCADGSAGTGSCDGDSGGPLVYHHGNIEYQVGVTAFGSAGGCEIGFPTVYSRITNYLNWISRKTGLKLK